MRNYFTKRPSGAPLHILSKLYDVPVGFEPPPPYFEAEYCLFCGRRRVAVARYRMICLVLYWFDFYKEWKSVRLEHLTSVTTCGRENIKHRNREGMVCFALFFIFL